MLRVAATDFCHYTKCRKNYFVKNACLNFPEPEVTFSNCFFVQPTVQNQMTLVQYQANRNMCCSVVL